ncbi:hypothetical protein GCM10008023_19700 [Sphingomonas glacialis]|uniref:Sel1 repeat family protein n=1 Tax=Sphingomonas glacialis TaxID=658225 RepID=A0ABQ3LHY2_9SPHN|nr:hypothetical protein [Sphingomonas glacialis]GHH16090.1 hypothetical protein GCM10008023_19700 [Sphingomonas glacialis]
MDATHGALTIEGLELPQFDANAGVGLVASLALLGSANGDLSAQRYIRDDWSANLYAPEREGPDSDLRDAGGLLLARLCAAHGDATDANMLAMLLFNAGLRFRDRGRFSIGWECVAEALSLYERLGAAGDAEAVETAKGIMASVPVEVIEMAKNYSLQGNRDGAEPAPTCIRTVH